MRLPLKELRLTGLAVAAAGSLCAAVYLLSAALGPGSQDSTSAPEAAQPDVAPAQPSPANPSPALLARRAQIEQTIAATPGVSAFFDRLRATLPADYEAAIVKAAATPAGGASDAPDYWLSDAVKIVRQSHGALAAKADAGPLQEVFTKQSEMLARLADTDPRLCVDFLYGGASEGFFRFAAANRTPVGDLALASLDAAVSGQTTKIDRGTPTDADFQALETALRDKGLNEAEIGALLDGKAPDPPLPDDRLCTMGRLYLDALASLPEDARLRLYALAIELMARS